MRQGAFRPGVPLALERIRNVVAFLVADRPEHLADFGQQFRLPGKLGHAPALVLRTPERVVKFKSREDIGVIAP